MSSALATIGERGVSERWTDKLERFVGFYCGDARFNATIAAEMAGYAVPTTSGWECMQRNDVKQAIKQRCAASAMHSEELLMLLGHEARGPGDYIDVVTEEVWEGEGDEARLVKRDRIVVDVKAMRRDGKRSLIKKVTRGPHGDSVEFVDPLAAQAILVKVHNLDTGSKADEAAGLTEARNAALAAMAGLAGMAFAAGQASAGVPPNTSGYSSTNTTDVVIAASDAQATAEYGPNATAMIVDVQRGLSELAVTPVAPNENGYLPGDAQEQTGRSTTGQAQTVAGARLESAATDGPPGELGASADVVEASMGMCMLCGEQPASKQMRGGAKVCENCVP